MSAESVVCDHCGAPLEIDAGASYVVCGHCGSRLRVKRSASAAWTELAARTDRIEAKVDRLDRRAALAELDRKWERHRDSLTVRGKRGRESEPTVWRAVCYALVGVFGAVLAAAIAGGGFPTTLKIGFPLLFAGVGLASGASTYLKAKRWREVRREYDRRRAELLSDRAGDS